MSASNPCRLTPEWIAPMPMPSAPLASWTHIAITAWSKRGSPIPGMASRMLPASLVRADGAIWFVAAQLPMQAPLCVRTLRRLSFMRPSGPVSAGANSYGGVTSSTASGVLTGWPAAMATPDTKGQIELATTTTLPQAMWSVLLPPLDWRALAPGDTMTDDLGRSGVVDSTECTELGWRLVVRQSAS